MKVPPSLSSPGAILWLTGLLAALVLAGGVLLARSTERVASPPPGNRVDATFHAAISRITEMQKLWHDALAEESMELLDTRTHGDTSWESSTAGVTRVVILGERLNPVLLGPRGLHPILEKDRKSAAKDAKNAPAQPEPWIIDIRQLLGIGFREIPGRPPLHIRGSERKVVAMVLDPDAAAAVVMKDLADNPELSFATEPGRFQWRAYATTRPQETESVRPDEILRHVSRFGNFELRRWFPTRSIVHYHVPTVAGASAVAVLLVVTGMLAASGQRRALRVAEERVSFVNRVSHELRSPLTNLLLNTDLAIDELPPSGEKVGRRLSLIREETGRLSRIVDNVLAFARQERGASSAEAAPCRPAELVESIRRSFTPLLERKDIRCIWHVDLPGPHPVDGDAFSQILSNLLSNVEKYAGPGATCHITGEAAGGTLTLTVADDGPGVPAVAREKIFRPFGRAREGTREGVSGTGLGLSISRDLAARMGGTLELLPSVKGAVFRLVIPTTGKETGAC
ncbi:HAMP domain-containing sensor histidine kinase [Luteolibacter sp. SL250]|uniref:sensor histidine kinase n=1 Tax=Luteolibacter sp. SL250 TaxID=2995170 RepID=UPI00226F5C3C|nr:HAMP domain-containing sensor histidine kinase [Luteolibacter sp. SL250]WAC21462.1 HAMP domain-containing sensor histidine kinase [Luteolibacter sp. SL250]